MNGHISKEITCDEQKFAFSNMISKLDLDKKGYSVSEYRGMVNVQLVEELPVDNRKIKEVLLAHSVFVLLTHLIIPSLKCFTRAILLHKI